MAIVKAGTISEFELASGDTVMMYCGSGEADLEINHRPWSLPNEWQPVQKVTGVEYYTATDNENLRLSAPDDADAEYVTGSDAYLSSVPDSRIMDLGNRPAVTCVSAAFAATLANNGGDCQFDGGATTHGLTAMGSVAAGAYVYVSAWTGTGVPGLYALQSREDANKFTIALAYDAALGDPTVAVENDSIPLAEVTIPANTLGIGGQMHIGAHITAPKTANSQTLIVDFGGVEVVNTDLTTLESVTLAKSVTNIGGGDIGSSAAELLVEGGSTGAPVSGAVDCTTDQTLTFSCELDTADEVLTLGGYLINCRH